MIIALFSDIHANLPALEAVLKDIDARKPDALYCLGDLVGYNIWPNEVIEEIKKRGIPTLAGNYDQGVGRNSDDCGCAYKTKEDKAMGAMSIAYSNARIHDEKRQYLRTLPAHIKLEFEWDNERFSILFVHGSPRKINEYLFEDREEKSMRRIMQDAGAQILCFGHTHKPYHRKFELLPENDSRYFIHAVNTGSVGKPKDNDPRACYCLLHLNEKTNLKDPDFLQVEFVRVAYNVEKAARAIEESVLPDAYADMLRKAY